MRRPWTASARTKPRYTQSPSSHACLAHRRGLRLPRRCPAVGGAVFNASATAGPRRPEPTNYDHRMGTVREYGYREYSDDLTPGNGGQSSLLFNAGGGLSGHAPFRSLGIEGDGSSAVGGSGEPDAVKALVAVGAIALVAATGYGAKKLWDLVQSKRKDNAASDDVGSSDNTSVMSIDEQDELIDEVHALIKETEAQGAPQAPSDTAQDFENNEGEARTSSTPQTALRGE